MSDNSAPYHYHHRDSNRGYRADHLNNNRVQHQMLEHDGRDSRVPQYANWLPPPPPPPGMLPVPPNPAPFLPNFTFGFPVPQPPPLPSTFPATAPQQSNLDPNALDHWNYYSSSQTGNSPNSNNMNRNYGQPNTRNYGYPNSPQNRQHPTTRSQSYPHSPVQNNRGNIDTNYHRAVGAGAVTRNNSVSSPTLRSNASNSAPSLVRLGSIPQVRTAFQRYADESNIMLRFAQFCSGTNRAIAPNRRRSIIHDFSGFQRSDRPRVEAIMHLTKPDLDNLAWSLGVPRGGRKTDVASRISVAMQAPLQWRVPTSSMPEPSPGTVPTSANGASYGASNYGTNSYSPVQLNNNMARGNMPALPPSAALTSRNRVTVRRRAKDISTIVNESDFMTPETPFNVPVGKPLGYPSRMMFTSVQLSNGMVEPKVSFVTPNLDEMETNLNVKGKGVLQVHLRCLKVEAAKPVEQWKQSWPFPAAGKVNSSNVELDQAQRFTNGKLAGTDKATNITPYLRKKREGKLANVVTLRRNANSCATTGGSFVVFAQPILVRNTATMADIVKQNSLKYWTEYRKTEVMKGMKQNATDFEMGKRQVAALMAGGDGLTVSSQKVSLKCPLSLVPISTPVRGKDCTHIQCFDLTNYLDFTRRSTKFTCPVCNKKDASPSSLIISWYINEALTKFAGCDEVEVTSDGGFKAVQNVRTGVASHDSDSDDDYPAKKKVKTEGTGATNGKGSAPVVVISLDSDDDDDEPPRGATQPTAPVPPPPQPPPPVVPAGAAPPPALPHAHPPLPVHQAQPEQSPPYEEWLNDDNDDDDFEVEFQFDADDSVYPWEVNDQDDKGDTDRNAQLSADGKQSGRSIPNGQSGNSGPVFENGIEVITIDSD